MSAAEIAPYAELTTPQVEHVYRDIISKRRATSYLHAAAFIVDDPASRSPINDDASRVSGSRLVPEADHI